MVKLRLRRVGKKKQPMYKIVAADSRAPRRGKFIEAIGQYNPLVNPIALNVNETRLYSWLKRGAQPTDTLRGLLKQKGLWLKWGLMKKGADEATIGLELEKWQMLQSEKLHRRSEKKARLKATRKKKISAEAPAVAVEATPAAAPAIEPAESPAA